MAIARARRHLRLRAGGLLVLLARREPGGIALVVLAHLAQRDGLRLLPPQLRELEGEVGLARSLLHLGEDALELGDHLVALALDGLVVGCVVGGRLGRDGRRRGALGAGAGVLDRVPVVADLVGPVLAVELPVLLPAAGQRGPVQLLRREQRLEIDPLLEKLLLSLEGLEPDDLDVAVERVGEAGEAREPAPDQVPRGVRHRCLLLPERVQQLGSQRAAHQLGISRDLAPFGIGAPQLREHRLDALVLAHPAADRRWQPVAALHRSGQLSRRRLPREEGLHPVAHRQVPCRELRQGFPDLRPQAVPVVDDCRQALRLRRVLVRQLRRAQAVQLAQRGARIAAAHVGVGTLEERLVPVAREARHRRVCGRGLPIPAEREQGPARGELRQLLHLGESGISVAFQRADRGEDAQRLAGIAALRNQAGQVVGPRVHRAAGRNAVGESRCIRIPSLPVGRQRERSGEARGEVRLESGDRLGRRLLQRGRGGTVQRLHGHRALQRARVERISQASIENAQIVDGRGGRQPEPRQRLRQEELRLRALQALQALQRLMERDGRSAGVAVDLPVLGPVERVARRGVRRGRQQRCEEDGDSHRCLV